MPITIQLSDKRGDAILLVKAEGPANEIDGIFAGFGAAVQDAGLDESYARFSQVSTVADPLAAAQRTVQAVFPGAVPASGDQWGQPPVPQFQPQMPAAAAAPAVGGAPTCVHGTKQHVTGTGKNPPYAPWQAWGCPAKQGDPTKCKPGLDFIRG